LYLTSIGIGIGALVDANTGSAGVNGVSYLVFLAPALLASAAIQSTMDEVMFPTLAGFVWDKGFIAMNATALTGRQIARGVMIAAILRTVFTVVVYWLILVIFGAVDVASSILLIPASLFAGWGMGAAMLAVASFVEKDDGFFAVFGRFVVAPMFLFSGTYYPLDSMPTLLQPIGWVSPLWHATEAGRVLSYGAEVPTWLFITHFIYLGLLGVIGMYIAERQYTRRLAK
jgi:lipooligosaccharide transport system permease protein